MSHAAANSLKQLITDLLPCQARQAIYGIRAKLWRTATTQMGSRMKNLKPEQIKATVAQAKSQYGELYYADGDLRVRLYHSAFCSFLMC